MAQGAKRLSEDVLAFMESFKTILKRKQHCVMPLWAQFAGAKNPRLLGSSTLFSRGNDRFLCLAKHTLDDCLRSNVRLDLLVPADGYQAVLEGEFFSADEYDVCVKKLTKNESEQIHG